MVVSTSAGTGGSLPPLANGQRRSLLWRHRHVSVTRLVPGTGCGKTPAEPAARPCPRTRKNGAAKILGVDEGLLPLIVGGVLAASIVVAFGATRAGVPSLVAFLALGMLLGSDGLGGIEFDDAELARKVGVVALAAILFEGGLATSWRRLREVVVPATMLATVGVLVTTLLTGLAAYALFDLSWLQSLLLGAVVSSTDAAAVFATLRFTHIRRRLARTLEAETGGNDPMAIALTIGLINWIEKPDYGIGDLALLLVRQLGLGLLIGLALGAAATWAFARLPHSIGAFAPVASVAAGALSFGIADVSGGSGFLAVYLVGLAVGSTPSRFRRQLVAFHEGLAFIAQVACSSCSACSSSLTNSDRWRCPASRCQHCSCC
jgi:potassium/hydrogen antiporter